MEDWGSVDRHTLVLVLLVLVVGVVEGVVVVGEARRQAPWVVGRLVALKRAIQR
jgi:hypothetical protein